MGKEWKDWLSDKELFSSVYFGFRSLGKERLDEFAYNILEEFSEDTCEDSFNRNIANDLLILNKSINGEEFNQDYVFVIDTFENEGIFRPNQETVEQFISKLEKWTGISF